MFSHVEYLLKEMQAMKIELNVTKNKLDKAEKEIKKLNSQGPISELKIELNATKKKLEEIIDLNTQVNRNKLK